MGQRQRDLRAELEANWTVYEPRVPGTPFRKKDLVDAQERPESTESTTPVGRGRRGNLALALAWARGRS